MRVGNVRPIRCFIGFYTLKTPGSAWPGKGSIGAKLHSGSTITAEISQLDAKYDPELGQSDPIICKFDWFPGHRWHGMEFGPNGPFSGSRLTRVFLECNLFFKTSPKVMLRKIIRVINSTWESSTQFSKFAIYNHSPAPSPIYRIRGTYARYPSPELPFLGKKIYPLSQVLVNIGFKKKIRVSREISRPSFPRKMWMRMQSLNAFESGWDFRTLIVWEIDFKVSRLLASKQDPRIINTHSCTRVQHFHVHLHVVL